MEWKTVKYNDKYEVSDTGLVRRKDSGHILSGCIAQGYQSVKLTFEHSKQKRFKNHRLVAEHFIENDDPEHKIFDLQNNFIDSFPSMKKASEALNIAVVSIARCVHGESQSCKGYKFIPKVEGSTTTSPKSME